MIVEVCFEIFFAVFGSFISFVFPALPEAFNSVLRTVLNYISMGLPYVWLFVDKGLVLQLFYWWCSTFLLIFTGELTYNIWKFFKGTADNHTARRSE